MSQARCARDNHPLPGGILRMVYWCTRLMMTYANGVYQTGARNLDARAGSACLQFCSVRTLLFVKCLLPNLCCCSCCYNACLWATEIFLSCSTSIRPEETINVPRPCMLSVVHWHFWNITAFPFWVPMGYFLRTASCFSSVFCLISVPRTFVIVTNFTNEPGARFGLRRAWSGFRPWVGNDSIGEGGIWRLLNFRRVVIVLSRCTLLTQCFLKQHCDSPCATMPQSCEFGSHAIIG